MVVFRRAKKTTGTGLAERRRTCSMVFDGQAPKRDDSRAHGTQGATGNANSFPEHVDTDGSGLRIDACWDIETEDWTTFVVGGLWTVGDSYRLYRDEDSFAEALLELPQGHVAWAHAGGRFDVLWLLDWCRRRKRIPTARITMSGSAIASLAIKGGPTFRDSNRLIPMSLAKASTMFPGQTKERLELPCTCGRGCGGYCAIRRDMRGEVRKRVEEYLEADVLSLRDTMLGLVSYAAAHGIMLAGTVAGSTWRTAKSVCGVQDAEWEFPIYKFVRSAYAGGRVEVGKTKAKKVWRYDRTQAYPSALCGMLPVGLPRGLSGKLAGAAFGRGIAGAYAAVVEVPVQHSPPLPVRLASRLAYPHGVVRGTWPRDEIRHAEECGAKILRFEKAVVWAEEAPFMKPYMERCFELRQAAPTESLKTWLKFLANSFSGAVATDPERDIIVLGEDYADDPRYEEVGRYGWIWRRSVFQISPRAHIHLAMTLTGDARVELHRQILVAGDSWCYSDTDSVISSKELTRRVGGGLGEWKFEGTADDFEALAPKIYGYVVDGKRFARAKGFEGAAENWGNFEVGVKNRGGVKSLLTAAKSPVDEGLFVKKSGGRAFHRDPRWIGSRIRDGEGTRAPSVTEIRELE